MNSHSKTATYPRPPGRAGLGSATGTEQSALAGAGAGCWPAGPRARSRMLPNSRRGRGLPPLQTVPREPHWVGDAALLGRAALPRKSRFLAGLVDRLVELGQLLADALLVVAGKVPAMDPVFPGLLILNLAELIEQITSVVGSEEVVP